MKQLTVSKLAKEYDKAVYCHLAYLNSLQSTSCKMPGWMKHKLESRLAGEISITSDMQTYQSNGGSEEELKGFLRAKVGLKLNIEKKKQTKIMASDTITSWQIEGDKVEAKTDFISWAPKSL